MKRTRAKARAVRGGFLGAVVLGGILTSPSTARADFDFQFAANMNGGWLRQTPALASKSVSTVARDLREGNLKSRGGLALMGLAADVELTLDDRWRGPLIGGAAYWTVGSQDTVVTGYDGSIARIRPSSAFRGDLLFPGIGHRWKHRRTMWGLAVRSGVSFLSMGGSVAAGAGSVELELSRATFLVQLEVEGCRRVDPTTRICLQVVPRVYEHELLNGLVFGLRMEFGR
jgi:hypothetical protein